MGITNLQVVGKPGAVHVTVNISYHLQLFESMDQFFHCLVSIQLYMYNYVLVFPSFNSPLLVFAILQFSMELYDHNILEELLDG